MHVLSRLTLPLSLILSVSFSALSAPNLAAETTPAKIVVSSASFTKGSTIPKKHTADGKDISPSISWDGIPEGSKSIAMTCEDPDAPSGTWFHWIIYNIAPTTKSLKENIAKKPALAKGMKQGSNDFRKVGYNGPSPPRGKAHHYNFKVFALNEKLALKEGCNKREFYKAIKGKVLGRGQITALYQRR